MLQSIVFIVMIIITAAYFYHIGYCSAMDKMDRIERERTKLIEVLEEIPEDLRQEIYGIVDEAKNILEHRVNEKIRLYRNKNG